MKLPKTFGDIIEFATENSLTLISQDSKTSEIILGGISITTTSPLAAGEEDVAYTDTIETEGDSGSVEFTIASGSLPTGLSLAKATGVISGTPTVPGTVVFTVKAYDTVYQASVQKEFTIVVSA
jgi:hypothetical protein